MGATVQGGLKNVSLGRDVDKLVLLLDEYKAVHASEPPLAYLCLLDNHARKEHYEDQIKAYCETISGGRIEALHAAAVSRPLLTANRRITL